MVTKRDILDVLLLDLDNEWPDVVIERHGGDEAVVTVNGVEFYVNVSRRRIPHQVRKAWDGGLTG